MDCFVSFWRAKDHSLEEQDRRECSGFSQNYILSNRHHHNSKHLKITYMVALEVHLRKTLVEYGKMKKEIQKILLVVPIFQGEECWRGVRGRFPVQDSELNHQNNSLCRFQGNTGNGEDSHLSAHEPLGVNIWKVLLAVQHEELTDEDLMELEAQRKDEERQEEEVTEEPKRLTMQEMARGFSLFEEALLAFEA
ncbi:thioredoxin reductase-like selenoprotein T isoform X2 [Orcinus orca]|uniref:thioredoxin reductase-like selenoprotein T isoform X2 n=1 Tax=Orcinus orca TaxID=9733 RepID=UPI002112A967|nr:thioredoxin reductase-like selenoprotein T isoform X2 [Orcinus orca]